MKTIAILAAAAAAAFAVPASAAPAPAAPSAPITAAAFADSQVRVVVRDSHRRGHRRAYWRTVCTTKWRHHRRVRTCRKVRAWR